MSTTLTPDPVQDTPDIESMKPAHTRVSQAFVLANLPEPALLSMMNSRAQTQDDGWYQTMVDGGLLRIDREAALRPKGEELQELTERWSLRTHAMVSFMRNGTMTIEDDGASPVSYAVLNATDEFKRAFERATDDVLRGRGLLVSLGAPVEAPRRALALWASAAAMLNLPEVVKAVVCVQPDAAHELFTVALLGPEIEPFLTTEGPKGTKINPLGVAFAFSRERCVDAMLQAGHTPLMVMGKNGFDENIDLLNLDQVSQPVCAPSMYGHAMASLLNPKLSKTLHDNAYTTSRLQAWPARFTDEAALALRPYAVVAAEQGLALDPLKVIECGLPAVGKALAERFSDDDWQRLPQVLGKAPENGPAGLEDAAVLAMLSQAQHKGREKLAFGLWDGDPQGDALRLEPVQSLAEKGHKRSLLAYLDHHLSPEQAERLKTNLESTSPQAFEIVAAHQASRVAQQVMDDVEASTRRFRP